MSKKNGKLEELIKSGEVIVHPRTASKAALKRAAKGQFKTFRLKKGMKLEKVVKDLR